MQQSSTTLKHRIRIYIRDWGCGRLLHAQMCHSVVLGTWFVQTSGNTAVTRQSDWSYGVCVCVCVCACVRVCTCVDVEDVVLV